MSAKRWIVRAQDSQRAASLARVLGVSPVVASLLIARGCAEETAAAEGYKLVVSVDCGIRAHEPLYWARDNGLDLIITDHHLPDEGEGVPPAYAVLNPNQRGCTYPDKNLAGVGVAFKLVDALFRERDKSSQVPAFLKVVAIGTVADVAK